MFGYSFLARVRTRILQPQIKSDRRALQRFETYRAGDVGDSRKAFCAQKRQPADGVHRLCAVEQCQAFFGFELHGLELSLSQRFGAGHPLPFKECLAFADETQSQMCQRRQVAARTHRAFFRNHWTNAPIEHFAEQLDDLETDSTETEGQNIRPQHHHCPYLRLRHWISNSAGVAADKVQLELAQFAMRNADLGELAESSVDSVNDRITLNDLFDCFARGENAWSRHRRNPNGLASASHRCKLEKRNLLTLELHLRSLVRIQEKEKGQAGTRPGLLGESAQTKITRFGIYFPDGAGGGVTTSLCCAQAPSPKAVTKTATTIIVFNSFNLSHLL